MINLTEIRKFPLLLLFFVFSFCVPPPCFFFANRRGRHIQRRSNRRIRLNRRIVRAGRGRRVEWRRIERGEKEGGEAEPRARHRGEGID